MNTTLLSIISIAVAIVAVVLMTVFVIMYSGCKRKLSKVSYEFKRLNDSIILVFDEAPKDERRNTAVMKLQNELSKYVIKDNGSVGVYVLDPNYVETVK